jgi:membrane protease YdiL (CAAX protease family)
MLENTPTTFKSAWFFISRLFILGGMVLFFFSLFSFLGIFLSQWIFGYDFIGSRELLGSYSENPGVLNALKLMQVVISIGAMVIPALYFPKALEQQPADFLKTKKSFSPFFGLMAVLVIFLSVPAVSWLFEINQQLELPASLQDLERKFRAAQQDTEALAKAFIASDTIGGLLVNLVVVALVPAIAEELLFRGALQQFIRFCFNNKHSAIISSALIFSAFHGEVYSFLPRFGLGIVLGYLFTYSGSLWPAVIAHFTNNALSLLATHFHWSESGVVFLQDDYSFPFYIIALSVLLTGGVVFLMFRQQQKKIFYNGE